MIASDGKVHVVHVYKIMNFIKVTYNDYMNFINITWRSIGECIGGIGKENVDELLRSGLYESKDSWFFDEFPSDRRHRMLWISALRYKRLFS